MWPGKYLDRQLEMQLEMLKNIFKICCLILFLSFTITCCYDEENFSSQTPNKENLKKNFEQVSTLVLQMEKSSADEASKYFFHTDYRVRRMAVLRIEKSASIDKYIPALSKLLFTDKHSKVKTAAARALGKSKKEDALQALVQGCADVDYKVRFWSWKTLVQTKELMFPIVIKNLRSDCKTRKLKFKNINSKTLTLAGQLKQNLIQLGKQSIEPMIDALLHEDYLVVRNAVRVLGGIGPDAKDALVAIAKVYEKGSSKDKIAVIKAFEQIGDLDPCVMPTLYKATENSSEKIAKAAKTAIKRIDRACKAKEREKAKKKKKQEEDKWKREEEKKAEKEKADKPIVIKKGKQLD